MKYSNPIILSDYSDPDVIRYKDSFYLIASSFNHTPGIPVLKSKNLVDWKIINYVYDKIPLEVLVRMHLSNGWTIHNDIIRDFIFILMHIWNVEDIYRKFGEGAVEKLAYI